MADRKGWYIACIPKSMNARARPPAATKHEQTYRIPMLQLHDPLLPATIGRKLAQVAASRTSYASYKTTPRPYAVYKQDDGYLITTPSAGVDTVHAETKKPSTVTLTFTPKDQDENGDLLYQNRGPLEATTLQVRLPDAVDDDITITEKGGELRIMTHKQPEDVRKKTTYTVT
jgi:HSP20 family molecular chaperone IbpA